MTTKRGPGRPPAKNPLAMQLMLRLTDEEVHQLDALADSFGLTRQQYIRMSLIRAYRIMEAGGDPFPLLRRPESASETKKKKGNAA